MRRGRGHDLSDQLEPLASQSGQIEEQTREVAAGPRKTRRKSVLDGISFKICSKDRDRSRRIERGPDSLRAEGIENIDIQAHELRREAGQSLEFASCPSVLKGNILAFDVTEVP